MPSREVRVAIIGDPSSLQRALSTADRGVSTFSSRMQSVGGRLRSVGSSMTRNLTLPLVGFGILAARELSAGETALAQTEAVIESTGGAARKSVEDIVELSQALSDLTSLDDEPIQEAANTLLTFRNIAGRTFDEATAATLDLSVAMDKDLRSSAVLVGKALNDPLRGLSALSRVGIQFTDQQRDMIQMMVYFGDTAGAQRIILEELNAEFGGSAEALGGTVTGRLNRLRNNLEALGASILEDLLPVLEDLAGVLEGLADAYDNLTPGQQRFAAGVVGLALVAGPLTSTIGLLTQAVGLLGAALTRLGVAFGIAGGWMTLIVATIVVTIGFLIWMRDKWDEVSRGVSNAVANIVNNIPGARMVIEGLARAVNFVRDALSTMSNWARRAADTVASIGDGVDLGPLGGAIRGLASALSSALGVAAALLETMRAIASLDLRAVPGVSNEVGGAVNAAINQANGRNRVRESARAPSAREIAREIARELSVTPQPVYINQ